MKEHDVIKFMSRFPDKIMTKEEVKKDSSFKSKTWKCSRCGCVYGFKEGVGIPAPCSNCGDIFFEKLKEE
mgnify:CR=1 FL=1